MPPRRLNATWRTSHPMPKNASLEQRIRWHRGHAKACACREMPENIRAEIERRSRNAKAKTRPRARA